MITPPLPNWKRTFQILYIYIFILIADVHIIDPLAGVAGNVEALHPSQEVVLSALAQSTLRKGGPDLAHVGATRQGGVSVQDGVTGLGEVGVTRLPIAGLLLAICMMKKKKNGADKISRWKGKRGGKKRRGVSLTGPSHQRQASSRGSDRQWARRRCQRWAWGRR